MERINAPVTGAWMLLLFRAEGLKLFQLDQDHFKLSWFAVPLAAPFFLLCLLATNQMMVDTGALPIPLWIGLMSFIVCWAAVSAMIIGAFMLGGRRKMALPALLVFNWLQLVTSVAVTPLVVVAGFQLVPDPLPGALLLIAVLFGVLVKGHFLWRILGPAWAMIIAIVAGEVALSLLIDRIFS
jgi:hypothetical protein